MEETESLNAKNSSLSLEVSNLKNSLNTQSGEMDILKKKVQELQQQNEMLSADKENGESLSDQVEELQKQHRAEIAEKEENCEKLKANVDQLQAELNIKKKLLCATTDSFNANIAVLEADIKEKQKQIVNFQTTITKLNSELSDKEQQSNDVKNQLHGLKTDLQEKQQQVEKYDAMTSDISAKFEKQLVELKTELQEKHQLIDQYQKMMTDLNVKFENQLQEKQQQVDTYNAMTSDISAKFEKQLVELNAELLEKKQLLDNHATVVTDLKLNLSQKFQSELLKLKTELQEKQQQQNELLEIKAELQLKRNQLNESDQIISKLQSEMNEKVKNELSAKNVIACLESQLRSNEPNEPKGSSPKGTKPNVHTDRKTKRHSQHDESRLWLDDSIEPPSSVATQTDPTDKNCSCESMNLKITELKRQLAIKTAVVNTQRLEMENHPLIGANKDLKRALDDKQAEVNLLKMDVDHYKAKCERERKQRQCSCINRVMESKEVQVDCDNDLGVEQDADQNGVLNGQNEEANGENVEPNKQNGVLNGRNEVANGENVVPNKLNGSGNLSTLQTYYMDILPRKYRQDIEGLEKEKAALTIEKNKIMEKSNFYKDLALSRREQVKTLNAKLGIVEKPGYKPTPAPDKGNPST